MFASAGYASARKSYANAEIGARVEAASPHELIAVLFEELLKNVDTLGVGLSANGTMTRAAAIQRRSRINTILIGLEASLNHNQGGDIAGGLLSIYREARRLIGEGVTAGDPKPVIEARGMIAEIAEAWSQIG